MQPPTIALQAAPTNRECPHRRWPYSGLSDGVGEIRLDNRWALRRRFERFDTLDCQVEAAELRLEARKWRANTPERRLDGLDRRFGGHEQRKNAAAKRQDATEVRTQDSDHAMTTVDGRLSMLVRRTALLDIRAPHRLAVPSGADLA